MSTVGGHHDTCGGYHEYRGGVQYHGVLKEQTPTVLNTLHGTHDSPMVLNIPHST